MTLRIYLTGNVTLEDGTTLVTERRFQRPQVRRAFAALVWHRDTGVSTDELAEIVWDGRPPPAWPTALRALVSRARSAIGEVAGIEQTFGTYRLRLPPDAWIDVQAAESAAHEAEVALREGALEAAMGPALVANAITRRPFLSGDTGEWCERRREYLRGLRIRALEVRASVALANADAVGAATDAAVVVELEPYRETAYALLMKAHAAAGNPAQAVATYGALRERLASDLGTQPSPETEAVFLDVLAGR